MADTIQNDVVSSAKVNQAADQTFSRPTGLSVSRQVKIGVVLLLTFGGYFLMEDRPQPVAIDSASSDPATADSSPMQEFVDELQFIEPDESGTYAPPVTETTGLRLPAGAASPEMTTTNPHQSFNTMLASAPDAQSSHKPAVFEHARNNASESPRVTIRFTGHIEPLR